MRQTKYLFLGGPLDQQWRSVPPEVGRIVTALEHTDGPTTSRMVTYRLEYMSLPGWVVPLHMFVMLGRRQTEIGDALPGMVVGKMRERSAVPGNWRSIEHHNFALHTAIKRRGFRP